MTTALVTTQPRKVGRPQIAIDQISFEELCFLQCTLPEIAAVLHCSEDTVQRWCERTYGTNFAVVYDQNKAGGRAKLRRFLHRQAETNPACAIFLAKNHLGMSDKVEPSVIVNVQQVTIVHED